MILRLLRSRILVVVGTIAVLSLAGASEAVATTATGSQNPDLTVSVSLASRGTTDPEFATVGDTVDAALSVRNNKGWKFPPRLEDVQVRLTLGIPPDPSLGIPSDRSFTASVTVPLAPEQTLRVPFEFTVVEFFPKGLYSLTIEAFELSDPAMPPSSATATLTVY